MASGAKWITAQGFDLVLDAEDPGTRANSKARSFDPARITRLGGRVTLTRLTNGTTGGLSVVLVQVDGDDGSTLVFEASLRLLDAAVAAFKGRDAAESRPADTGAPLVVIFPPPKKPGA